jgi:hypothetical protein
MVCITKNPATDKISPNTSALDSAKVVNNQKNIKLKYVISVRYTVLPDDRHPDCLVRSVAP